YRHPLRAFCRQIHADRIPDCASRYDLHFCLPKTKSVVSPIRAVYRSFPNTRYWIKQRHTRRHINKIPLHTERRCTVIDTSITKVLAQRHLRSCLYSRRPLWQYRSNYLGRQSSLKNGLRTGNNLRSGLWLYSSAECFSRSTDANSPT